MNRARRGSAPPLRTPSRTSITVGAEALLHSPASWIRWPSEPSLCELDRGWRRKRVALAIDYVYAGRIVVGGGPDATGGWHRSTGVSRAAFHGSVRGINKLAPLGRVGFRKQNLFRDLAELWIAIVAVAVGESQLHCFDHGVEV